MRVSAALAAPFAPSSPWTPVGAALLPEPASDVVAVGHPPGDAATSPAPKGSGLAGWLAGGVLALTLAAMLPGTVAAAAPLQTSVSAVGWRWGQERPGGSPVIDGERAVVRLGDHPLELPAGSLLHDQYSVYVLERDDRGRATWLDLSSGKGLPSGPLLRNGVDSGEVLQVLMPADSGWKQILVGRESTFREEGADPAGASYRSRFYSQIRNALRNRLSHDVRLRTLLTARGLEDPRRMTGEELDKSLSRLVAALQEAALPAAPPPVPRPAARSDVPWYDPLEQRARDINDGFKGFQDVINTQTGSLNRALNENPLSRWKAQGALGNYQFQVEGMNLHVDPYLTIRADRLGAGVRGEAALLSSSLQREFTEGDWSVVKGVRGEFLARQELRKGESLRLTGLRPDDLNSRFVGPRVEVFEQWRRAGTHPWKLSAEVNAGAADDLANRTPLTYARATERAGNEEIAGPWLGKGSRVRLEAEQGVQYNFDDHTVRPYYRTFGGVGKPIAFHWMGRSHTVDVETGVQVEGNSDRPINVKPQARARVNW